MVKISFVIIGFNEGENIIKAINSIKELKLSHYEIIYIDSNSSDNSLELLEAFDIKKYVVKSNYYSAALARFIGSEIANGEYIFFLDGDMEIDKESDVEFCLNILNDDEYGVISGKLREKIYHHNNIVSEVDDRYNVECELETLKAPGGYFIIKKDILIEAGNFDARFKNNEEIDLFSRVKNIGYRIGRTNRLICTHNHSIDNQKKGYIYRFTNKFYRDFWLVLFKSIKKQYFNVYLSFNTQRKTIRSIIITFLTTISMIILPITPIFFGLACIYYTLLVIRKKSIKNILESQKYNLMIILSFIFIFSKISIKYNIKEI